MIYWFRPERRKGLEFDLQRSDFDQISGWQAGFRPIGVFLSQQTLDRQEVWAVTENQETKMLGMHVFWESEGAGELAVRLGSEQWNHG